MLKRIKEERRFLDEPSLATWEKDFFPFFSTEKNNIYTLKG